MTFLWNLSSAAVFVGTFVLLVCCIGSVLVGIQNRDWLPAVIGLVGVPVVMAAMKTWAFD